MKIKHVYNFIIYNNKAKYLFYMIWFPSSKLTLLKQDLIHKIKITFTCTLQQNYKTTSRPNPKSY